MSARERFDAKWRVNPVNGCWEWSAFIGRDGYGRIGRGPRGAGMERAHRFAWRLYRGDIPADMCVMHVCDNRRCVNPDHLILGTRLDNERDKVAKGRHHNQRKTACRNGHEYALHGATNGRGRFCRTCVRRQGLESYYRHTGRYREVCVVMGGTR
jgi:hypothetical protein